MKETVLARPAKKLILALALSCSAVPGAALADEQGRAVLSINNVQLQAHQLDGTPIALPSSVEHYVTLHTLLGAARIRIEDWQEWTTAPAYASSIDGATSATVRAYAGALTADLSSTLGSARETYEYIYAGFSSYTTFWLAPGTGLTLTGRVNGTVFLNPVWASPATSGRSLLDFSAVLASEGSIRDAWQLQRDTDMNSSAFDEAFSITAYNRESTPQLFELGLGGQTTIYVLSPVPEPARLPTFATGLALTIAWLTRARNRARKRPILPMGEQST